MPPLALIFLLLGKTAMHVSPILRLSAFVQVHCTYGGEHRLLNPKKMCSAAEGPLSPLSSLPLGLSYVGEHTKEKGRIIFFRAASL